MTAMAEEWIHKCDQMPEGLEMVRSGRCWALRNSETGYTSDVALYWCSDCKRKLPRGEE
ncbi:hypothetical protein LCGC14_1257040 [marine sediment metagenome]|uniref:Uncharacterized protein n=1 Tax=marine sediment metagenome TaxID=412755 RepID=A0A0F9P581_9ZZZZ